MGSETTRRQHWPLISGGVPLHSRLVLVTVRHNHLVARFRELGNEVPTQESRRSKHGRDTTSGTMSVCVCACM